MQSKPKLFSPGLLYDNNCDSYISKASTGIFFVAVTYLYILQGGIIVSHNSVDGLLNTFCLRRARLVAKDAGVEMTCSSEFSVEVEWMNKYKGL